MRRCFMSQPIHCETCHQVVEDIGPWCNLYITDKFCEPLMKLRRRIRLADSEGDGPLVNAYCRYIRERTNDNFVP